MLTDEEEFIDRVQHEGQTIDCLIVDDAIQNDAIQDDAIQIVEVFSRLASLAILLPTVVTCSQTVSHPQTSPGRDNSTDEDRLEPPPEHDRGSRYEPDSSSSNLFGSENPYHPAVLAVSIDDLKDLPTLVDRSIVSFLKLSPADSLPPKAMQLDQKFQQQGKKVLKRKQQTLAQKLKERLGYLSIYYKRDSNNFLRHMQPEDKKAFLAKLKQDYRKIVLGYFAGDSLLNQKIDAYVDTVFLADVPVSQVVEIHMDLMDDFAKQLQIEGRSEEILLDYRLTLIELLANLCEMYRRSIPREP